MYGVPLPRLTYHIDSYVQAGLAAARTAHDEIFERLGVSEKHHSPQVQGAGHIIGTLRMGSDAATSVVDGDLRSHDHPNLFIAGSAVFPTSATANPTLTIAALALRLAERIATSG
ncbi:GMC family oxidoreductase, partial [Nostoc sp. NIES-2111]